MSLKAVLASEGIALVQVLAPLSADQLRTAERDDPVLASRRKGHNDTISTGYVLGVAGRPVGRVYKIEGGNLMDLVSWLAHAVVDGRPSGRQYARNRKQAIQAVTEALAR